MSPGSCLVSFYNVLEVDLSPYTGPLQLDGFSQLKCLKLRDWDMADCAGADALLRQCSQLLELSWVGQHLPMVYPSAFIGCTWTCLCWLRDTNGSPLAQQPTTSWGTWQRCRSCSVLRCCWAAGVTCHPGGLSIFLLCSASLCASVYVTWDLSKRCIF